MEQRNDMHRNRNQRNNNNNNNQNNNNQNNNIVRFQPVDEPGIYFIPDLIDNWKANNINSDFLNFDVIEKYKDFGGIRIEDDILITADGCRFLGKERIPYHIDDVEQYVAEHRDEKA